MNTIEQRLAALRAWMEERGLDAFIIPTADPHGSEYVPDHWKCREFLTGFTGSAGTAVVTRRSAALWTDSRYFLQAADELAGTPFLLMREGQPGTPTVGRWLAERLAREQTGKRCGVCDLNVPFSFAANLHEETLREVEVVFTDDPFDRIWPSRPPLPLRPVRRQDERFMEIQPAERIRRVMQARGDTMADCPLLLTDLSEICWTLGLRGDDIDFNPVFAAYLFLRPDATGILFADNDVPPVDGIAQRPYKDVFAYLSNEADVANSLYIVDTANARIRQCASKGGYAVTLAPSPVPPLRAVKDEGERRGFRLAMERDGVALVQFRRWLDEAIGRGDALTEQAVDERLTALRAAQPGFESLSFGTIAAAGPHGAIVHYEADPTAATPLPKKSFLLLDSGAQYDCGTTDITRTIPLGPLTDEERRVYTLVMKAHIGLARLRFPDGTNGLQADTAARAPLWQAGLDFGHGTGHGVGSHLCVHEGQHQIRKDKRTCTEVPLREGFTVTDEPGVYLEGRFGVRLENVLLVRRAADGFLEFEALTLCPFDTAPLILSMLTHEETAYLNAYHAEVRRRLLPLLSDEADRAWLLAATRPV